MSAGDPNLAPYEDLIEQVAGAVRRSLGAAPAPREPASCPAETTCPVPAQAPAEPDAGTDFLAIGGVWGTLAHLIRPQLVQLHRDGLRGQGLVRTDCGADCARTLVDARLAPVHQGLVSGTDVLAFTRAFHVVVVPALCHTTAAKLAGNIADGDALRILFAALEAGVPIVAGNDALEAIAHPGVRRAAQEHVQYARGLGLRLVQIDRLAEAVAEARGKPSALRGRGGRTVITVEDTRTIEGPVLRVPPGTIVTPGARDALAARGIDVRDD